LCPAGAGRGRRRCEVCPRRLPWSRPFKCRRALTAYPTTTAVYRADALPASRPCRRADPSRVGTRRRRAERPRQAASIRPNAPNGCSIRARELSFRHGLNTQSAQCPKSAITAVLPSRVNRAVHLPKSVTVSDLPFTVTSSCNHGATGYLPHVRNWTLPADTPAGPREPRRHSLFSALPPPFISLTRHWRRAVTKPSRIPKRPPARVRSPRSQWT
jgi:hypothetical protein